MIRSTESGVAYEDTIAHLSESEREVIELVVRADGLSCLHGLRDHAGDAAGFA